MKLKDVISGRGCPGSRAPSPRSTTSPALDFAFGSSLATSQSDRGTRGMPLGSSRRRSRRRMTSSTSKRGWSTPPLRLHRQGRRGRGKSRSSRTPKSPGNFTSLDDNRSPTPIPNSARSRVNRLPPSSPVIRRSSVEAHVGKCEGGAAGEIPSALSLVCPIESSRFRDACGRNPESGASAIAAGLPTTPGADTSANSKFLDKLRKLDLLNGHERKVGLSTDPEKST